nr:hypothetical protein [Tanacetum cinerariifolium]
MRKATHSIYRKLSSINEWLLQQEAQPRLTRTPIFCDREDAERRLRADSFDDHCRMSISALMKCTAAIRQFAYGSTADAFDEYLQMSEHTARDALFFFNMCIIELYMPKYLRKPTSEDVCHGKHAFYGIAGANNDINVLDNSSLFDDLLDELAIVVPYVVNEVEYRNGYYLADGIYPEWASFVKSFTVAIDPKHTLNSVKKVHGKMSNVLSVFSKDVGDLFNNRPVHTKSTHYVESCMLAS